MIRKSSLHNNRIFSFFLAIICSFLLIGCSNESTEKKNVVLTTGFNKGELFKVEDQSCYLPEAMIYLINSQNQYESVYGDQIWQIEVDGKSMKDTLKDNILADLSQIKAIKIAAAEEGISLSEAEMELAAKAGAEYYASLTPREIEVTGATEAVITSMYEEYALANKLYNELIKDINPEISDDEARTITVEHIFFKTYTTDGSGEKIEYNGDAKQEIYEKAKMVHDLAVDGEYNFEELALEYSDSEEIEMSFCKGEMEQTFEDAGFELGKDEISDVIATRYGYHIIKCISTFNREETDLKKIQIAEEQRQEVFGEDYDEFAKKLLTRLNTDLWESVDIVSDENVNTQSYFECYHKYFD